MVVEGGKAARGRVRQCPGFLLWASAEMVMPATRWETQEQEYLSGKDGASWSRNMPELRYQEQRARCDDQQAEDVECPEIPHLSLWFQT